jgi:glycosyltransferase involved in cell wall biosynthesis
MDTVSLQPLVSVIVIFYNAQKYLREALESVIAQTCRDWELLLVDDGSTDSSPEIAWESVKQHPGRIHYLHHPNRENRGMSASRNLGIQHARGKYIAFLDADDVWFCNILQDQTHILENHPQAALVYGPLQWWYSWTGDLKEKHRDYIEDLGVPADRLHEQPGLLCLFLQDKASVPSGMLVRRSSIDQFGGFEDAFRGEYEDQVFCAKICLHAPVYVSSQTWYRYRQHAESCVALGSKSGQSLVARRMFLDWLVRYLLDHEVKDRRIWWALRQEYWRFTHPRLFRFLRDQRHLTRQIRLWWGRGH